MYQQVSVELPISNSVKIPSSRSRVITSSQTDGHSNATRSIFSSRCERPPVSVGARPYDTAVRVYCRWVHRFINGIKRRELSAVWTARSRVMRRAVCVARHRSASDCESDSGTASRLRARHTLREKGPVLDSTFSQH
jgi:hypothetical protein